MSSAKDVKQLFVLLEKHGFEVTMRNGGHYAIKPPGDKEDPKNAIYYCSATPQDWRTARNVIAWARRAGLPRIAH